MTDGVMITGDGSLSLQHPEHGECYHSHFGALREAQTLYLEGSGFIKKAQENQLFKGCSVLDIGLGLGYNAQSTIEAWEESPSLSSLTVVSLESDQALFDELKTGGGRWQKNWPKSWQKKVQSLEENQPNLWLATFVHPQSQALCHWWVFLGEAQNLDFQKVAEKAPAFHYIWQDAFSIQKCPELWTVSWFKTLHQSCHQDGVLMTYSVAKAVRQALCEGGWHWEKIPASTGKKSWLRASRKDHSTKENT